MDFEEWEYLPDAMFLDLQEEGKNKMSMRKRGSFPESDFNVDDRYFVCPSPNSKELNDSPGNSRLPELAPLPIPLKPSKVPVDELVTDTPNKVPADDVIVPSIFTEDVEASSKEADKDNTVSQVFFKVKEAEFVDMKLDSPKSGSRGFLPQIEASKFQSANNVDPMESMSSCSPRMKTEKEAEVVKKVDDHGKDEKVTWEDSGGGVNLWKWTLNGVGAICSFGFAATVCILVLGHQQRKAQHTPKIQFQIYADDKSIKRVVQQAAKLNEAINRAQITFGGYYDGV